MNLTFSPVFGKFINGNWDSLGRRKSVATREVIATDNFGKSYLLVGQFLWNCMFFTVNGDYYSYQG